MNKNEFNVLVGDRLTTAINHLGISQKRLMNMLEDNGYSITQSALSKVLSGTSIQPMHISQICGVLGLNISEVMSLNEEEKIHYSKNLSISSDKLIVDARHDAFRAYKGEFHGYFYTTKNEESLHHGIFNIYEDPSTHNCMATFSFKTGELDREGNEIQKTYTGPVTYSVSMQAFYCELCSPEIGEICYLVFHYDFLAFQDLECRLAVVITISSGIKRLPTMHKLMLTRAELTSTDQKYLTGQLRLNNSEILISENAYRALINDELLSQTKFFEYFGDKETLAEGFTSNVAKVTYYMLNESLISDSLLSSEDKTKIIGLLRKYSSAPRCNKVSFKAEEHIYKYLTLTSAKANSEEGSHGDDHSGSPITA